MISAKTIYERFADDIADVLTPLLRVDIVIVLNPSFGMHDFFCLRDVMREKYPHIALRYLADSKHIGSEAPEE